MKRDEIVTYNGKPHHVIATKVINGEPHVQLVYDGDRDTKGKITDKGASHAKTGWIAEREITEQAEAAKPAASKPTKPAKE